MYLWNVRRLVEEFREGRVSERQQLPYLLLSMGVSTLAADPYFNSVMSCETISPYDELMLPVNLLIVIIGTIFCYRSSSASSPGAGFVARYLCIGWPVFVRMVAAFIIALVLLVVVCFVAEEMAFIEQWADEIWVVTAVGFEVAYFGYLVRAIRASYRDR